ncbi:DUF1877 family protein [Streptomyces sp. NBC_01306]|uniref:DUF1877 family protein n=1 Tax=Streptomyces sp. NBC_01306 TaxID=2903819 RepID=UPI00224D86B7|nr:DUF1877 family protein [Streptomyces sp. NBC_01306]MCX4723141.1 YfbM family protein [Streptomyces sp. NBC_01306]
MNGEYLRVTPAELDRALKDPAWALDLAEEIQDAQEESEPAPLRSAPLHHAQDMAPAGVPSATLRLPCRHRPRRGAPHHR